MENLKPFAVVALLEDKPERGLRRGQVGTVVEPLAPGVFEVEFCDKDVRTYAKLALRYNQLMPLHHDMVGVAWWLSERYPARVTRPCRARPPGEFARVLPPRPVLASHPTSDLQALVRRSSFEFRPTA